MNSKGTYYFVMAYSQSIRKAQAPKPCDLCETNTNIRWRCVQCNSFICDKCKKIHLKFETFIQHDIIDVRASGITTSVEESDKPADSDLTVLKTYKTDVSIVSRLVSIDNKTAWIFNSERGVLRQVVIDDDIQTIKEITVCVRDMSLTHSNDVLISIAGSSEVKLLKSGEMQPFLSVAPLIPLGIHVTNNNNIILGVMETGGTYKLTDSSCRKVIVFDENKKEIQSYQYNKHKQRLFTVPWAVTCVNSDIVVIDRTSNYEGKVVVLGKEGDVKWTYEGQPQINTENKPFDPWDIVPTSVGNVIVAECNNHTLHVISGEGGQLLTYKVMSDQGVIGPYSLDIDTRGQLWVGCSASKGKSDAKVHIVKL